MTKLDQHFIDNGACDTCRRWVAENCATAAECWEKLLDQGRIEWALWWYVSDREFDTRATELARRLALRTARVHIAEILDTAEAPSIAKRMREISDTATLDDIALAARDARAALDARTARTALGALAALAALDALDARTARAARAARTALGDERKQQIADIRELLECPWTEDQQ